MSDTIHHEHISGKSGPNANLGSIVFGPPIRDEYSIIHKLCSTANF